MRRPGGAPTIASPSAEALGRRVLDALVELYQAVKRDHIHGLSECTICDALANSAPIIHEARRIYGV
jgi:hypothetical protein